MKSKLKLTFKDIFSDDFLAKLYTRFEKHINQREFSKSFLEVIESEIMVGRDLENIEKIFSNLDIVMSRSLMVNFLQTNCYTAWFPLKEASGAEFTTLEKASLTSWALFSSSDKAMKLTVEDFLLDLHSWASDDFFNAAFPINLERVVDNYESFIAENGSLI